MLTIGNHAIACTIEDISPRGCRISLNAVTLPHGRTGRLEIPKLSAVFRADIAWIRGDEAGLRLTVQSVEMPLDLTAPAPVPAAPTKTPAPAAAAKGGSATAEPRAPGTGTPPPRRIIPYGRHAGAASLTTR